VVCIQSWIAVEEMWGVDDLRNMPSHRLVFVPSVDCRGGETEGGV
jgi:hypothetical protein